MLIITKIPTMSDDELSILFKRACDKLANGPDDQAQSVKVAVENEWKKRRDCPRSDDATRPRKGMLAYLSYHVGANGEKTAVRRKILAHVVEGELPPVSSPAYTATWGAPSSSERYRKLTNVLQSQITNPAYADMEKAIIEWSEDLEWVQQKYGHLDDRIVLELQP